MANLYNGSSEGLKQVIEGFRDYSIEVAINRSFPSIVDGLKTSQRRIPYVLYKEKVFSLTKSNKVVGYIMAYHPHGDGAIYDTAVRMVDSNGSITPPMLKGEGNLGLSYSDASAAHQRYTSMCLLDSAKDLFLKDLDGVPWKPTETDEGLEPVYLPARFPMALTASVQGLGVGIANKIPSFNFGDVVKLTKEYIADGCQFNNQIIYPDLPNGGVVVANNSEMAKVMATGRGKIKSKSRISVNKRDVLIEELPYIMTDGKVIDKIKSLIRSSKTKKLNNGELNPYYGKFPYVTSENQVILTSDLKGFGIKITCRKAADVEPMLLELARKNITQNNYTSNMIFTNGNRLVMTGVYGVIGEWFAKRKEILTRKFNKQIDALSKELPILDYFIRLISNDEHKNKYLDIIANEGVYAANEYLEEIFEGISSEACDWISKRRANAFLNGGKYAKRFEDITNTIELYKGYLADLNTYIYDDLTEIENKYAHLYPRKTEITFKDYKFVKREEVVEVDDSYCGYVLYKDGTIQKASSVEGFKDMESVAQIIEGRANSLLVGFDYVGNLLRIYGDELPYGKTNLQTYLGVAGLVEDYKVMYLTVADGSVKRLLYRDGKMSVLDTNEFLRKKQRKRFVRNGVPEDVNTNLVEVFNEEDLDEYLYVADETKDLKLGVVAWKNLPVKSRLGKTRAFSGSKDMNITQYGTCDLEACHSYFTNMESFEGKLRKVKEGDVSFDGTEFEKGRFV